MNTKLTPPPAVRKWYAQIGKLGGKSKSPAKLAAIAKNAKKGGWPKGRPRKGVLAGYQPPGVASAMRGPGKKEIPFAGPE
ncbi:MAG: hypothetical protein ABSE16_01060 [Verrucomicrobiota bacterium]|jgi:hypothetical protein